MSQRVPRALRHPPMGRKQVFLPNFVLTLLRTPNLPPTFASFLVPLNLNKLDLRDYLYNGYNIRVNAVRSYIQMQKLRQDKPGARRPSPRKWFRPKSIKKMTVEMEQPFAWPEEPETFEKWDKATYDAAIKDRDASEEVHKPDYREKPTKERSSISQQAENAFKQAQQNARAALVKEGKAKKRVREAVEKMEKAEDEGEEEDNGWEDGAEEIEVEQDVELPVAAETAGGKEDGQRKGITSRGDGRKDEVQARRGKTSRAEDIKVEQEIELPMIEQSVESVEVKKKRGTSRADRVAKAKEGEPWRVEGEPIKEPTLVVEKGEEETK